MKTRHVLGSGVLFDLAAQGIDDYARETPILDLRDYLNGPLTASGLFIGLSGRVDRRFTVDMVGTWNGNQGRLVEQFLYSNGETGERCWTLRFTDEKTFAATAHDVVGTARGAQRGSAATMRYRLKVPRARGEIVVSMEDWFHLVEDGTLINRTRMSKFGIKVGELVVSFRKCKDGKSPNRSADSP